MNDVVIYGGGIAGAILARRLSADARVVLVSPVDYFEVPMAAPRCLVRPDFAERSIIPLAEAMPEVVHIRGRLMELTRDGGRVEDAQGHTHDVKARVGVLATGNSLANEAMRGQAGSAAERRGFYRRIHERLASARRVLLIGGGPIGIEVAGEISEAWPDKHITLIESQPRILAGTSAKTAARAAAILAGRGVSIRTGERIQTLPSSPKDVFAGGGRALTSRGDSIDYDLALWCTGGRPNTAYLQPHFAERLTQSGHVMVEPDLRVKGQASLFALGDITDLPENKMAFHIQSQVKVAVANIAAVLAGAVPLRRYRPRTGDPTMVVTLGSRMGVAHLPVLGGTGWSWLIRAVKADQMLVPKYAKALGG